MDGVASRTCRGVLGVTAVSGWDVVSHGGRRTVSNVLTVRVDRALHAPGTLGNAFFRRNVAGIRCSVSFHVIPADLEGIHRLHTLEAEYDDEVYRMGSSLRQTVDCGLS